MELPGAVGDRKTVADKKEGYASCARLKTPENTLHEAFHPPIPFNRTLLPQYCPSPLRATKKNHGSISSLSLLIWAITLHPLFNPLSCFWKAFKNEGKDKNRKKKSPCCGCLSFTLPILPDTENTNSSCARIGLDTFLIPWRSHCFNR